MSIMARLLNMRPDTEVEPHLAAHLTFLKQRNQREKSIRERRLTVLRIARKLGHPLADVTRGELEAWQLYPGTRPDLDYQLSPAAMHNAIVHIAQYLEWLVKKQIRVDNPSLVLVRPQKVHQGLPRPMAEDDVLRAIAAATNPVRMWIQLGANCGLRCMEIAELRRDWIVPGPPSFLRITGKGGKERTVTLPDPMLRELLTAFNQTGHLFNRMDGKTGPPSAVRVSERINEHLHQMGIEHTAHTLRHRFGTKLYQQSTDMLLVADEMGHGSIETTRGYVRLMSQRANAAVNAIYLSA